ncbi:MAG TPA: hypothetical protein VH372_12105 [Actinospica sp.]|nr:hypothetical protein [Actinospica sp.]
MTMRETGPPAAVRHWRGRVLLVVAAATLLGLLGWGITFSVGRADGSSAAARALGAQIAGWVEGSGAQIPALKGASQALARDVGRPNPGAVAGDANRLKAVVTAADAQPQIPDSEANADWETALAEYSSAVDSALAGANGTEAQALANADRLLGAGDTQLAALNQRILALGG